MADGSRSFNFPLPQHSLLRPGEIVVDLFAGGGWRPSHEEPSSNNRLLSGRHADSLLRGVSKLVLLHPISVNPPQNTIPLCIDHPRSNAGDEKRHHAQAGASIIKGLPRINQHDALNRFKSPAPARAAGEVSQNAALSIDLYVHPHPLWKRFPDIVSAGRPEARCLSAYSGTEEFIRPAPVRGSAKVEISTQAKHTARALINEARGRRLGNGFGFWCFFHYAQSARRRAAATPPPAPPALPIQPELFA